MFTNQNREVMKIPFSRLLKLEIPQLAEKMIAIIDKYDPEELKFKEINDLFLAEKPNIDAMTVPHGGHQITPKLKRLRAKLNLQVRSIKLNLEMVIKNDATGEEYEVLVLNTEITRFLEKFRNSKNEEVMHRKLTQFINEVRVNSELMTAMSAHGFTESMDNMQSILNVIIAYLGVRIASIAKRPKVKTAELSKSVLTAMVNVSQDINLAQLRNPGLVYTELIDELNQLLNQYKILINIRQSFNARKAEELLIAISGENEKAAAKSSKDLQLPHVDDVDDEA